MKLSAAWVFLLCLLPGVARASSASDVQRRNLCFNSACFDLEVADSPVSRRLGLMNRAALGPGEGMLFVFQEDGLYPIWMKNMQFPLDIIWLDKDLRVVFIASEVPPCATASCESIYPSGPARYVIEIPAGVSKQSQINPGDRAANGPSPLESRHFERPSERPR